MLDIVILLVTCIINLLLGTLALIRNPKQSYSKAFFSISFFVCAWAVSNYLTSHMFDSLVPNRVFNGIAFVCALWAVVSGVWFTHNFPVATRISNKLRVLLIVSGVLTTALCLTPFIAGDVYVSNGVLHFSTGKGLVLYVIEILLLFFLVARNLIRTYLHAGPREKIQALFILLGFTFTIIGGLLTNALLPALTTSWHSARFGPVFTIFLVAAIAYAIIKHKLFDIKLVVVRSLAYVMTLVVFAALYGFIVFSIANYIFDLRFSVLAQILLSTATGLAALWFNYFKYLFDRFTNKLFYRDAYDPQTFFDDFNKVLVSTIELRTLLTHAATSIAYHLKAQHCVIEVRDTGKNAYRLTGTRDVAISQEEVRALHKMILPFHQAVIVTDELTEGHDQLRKILSRNDIAVLAPLTNNVHGSDQVLGDIVLGPKKSGNPYTSQDIKVVETVANELVIAVQNALRFEEIEHFNATLQEKVAEATRRLKETNAKLKALDETKDDFISMASHQLRTPLTSVKGYLSLVLEGDAGKITPTQHKLLSQAFISSQRMVFLIADLLNVSRLKTGKFIIELAAVDLSEIVASEIDQLTETAASRDLTLKYTKPASFPAINLDETKTRQVIMNFIDNAIYYTPAGGHITVSLVDRAHSVELRVADNGIGVPKHEQFHLFSKFYRAKNAQKARPDGTGLGLFMAKKVIIAQGGSIIFQSTEGKGSVFGFSFPK